MVCLENNCFTCFACFNLIFRGVRMFYAVSETNHAWMRNQTRLVAQRNTPN